MKKTYFGFVGMTAAVSLALAGCSADAGTSAPSSAAAVQTDEAAQADRVSGEISKHRFSVLQKRNRGSGKQDDDRGEIQQDSV